jgi:formate-dependent nitrite reductase membrane component NrfD
MFAERRDGHVSPGGFDATTTREVYDVGHPAPWGWKIAAYLWTKSIASGVMLIGSLALILEPDSKPPILNIAVPVVALVALAMTMALLVFDLKKPARFFYLLTKPNFKSWLVLGGIVLTVYGFLLLAWLCAGVFWKWIPPPLVWATAALSVASAGYSAFLFAQAKGRDLWQSRLFFWHLIVQALIAGSAVIVLLELLAGSRAWDELGVAVAATFTLWFAPVAGLVLILLEVFLPHATEDTRRAIAEMVRGRLKLRFWGLAVGAGLVAPMLLLAAAVVFQTGRLYTAIVSLLLFGLWAFEDVWVKAGQAVPLS